MFGIVDTASPPAAGWNSLLSTKLRSPALRPDTLRRERLLHQLDRALDARLTLISAPAGYGKTTLLSDWLAHLNSRSVVRAWLSLDPTDNDPTRFWSYVVAALQGVQPHLGANIIAMLHEPQPQAIQTILTALINELAALPVPLVLVLDDYHAIQNPDIHGGLQLLLDYLPPNMHLVLATRSEPPLSLPRLRARQQLVELRAGDLRLSLDETERLLQRLLERAVDPALARQLDERADGWAAGIHLATLALDNEGDAESFIAGFSGSNAHVVDYLLEEVVAQQPEGIRHFLLQSSILDYLTADLCSAVTGETASQSLLDMLYRTNAFVTALDDKRRWFRFHPLFRDLLASLLRQQMPELEAGLHRRASVWFEQNHYPLEAVHHAIAADDVDRAADLIDSIVDILIWRRAELGMLRQWLEALPAATVATKPRLLIYHAWVLYLTNRPQLAGVKVDQAEAALSALEQAAAAPWRGMVAAIRSTLSGIQQDFNAALADGRLALALLPEHEISWRCIASINAGVSAAAAGDFDEATALLALAMDLSQEIGSGFAIVAAYWHVATLYLSQFRLGDAERICAQLELAATLPGPQRFPVRAYVQLLLGEIALERWQLEAAEAHLLASIREINAEGFPMAVLRCYVGLARVEVARGDVDAEADWFQRAELLERSARLKGRIHALGPYRVQRWLRDADYEPVSRWIREQEAAGDTSYPHHREGYRMALVQALIARGKAFGQPDDIQRSLALLVPLLAETDDPNRAGAAMRALALQALALDASGQPTEAALAFAHAVALAAPEGCVRVFTDLGADAAALLKRALELRRKGLTPEEWHIPTAFAATLLASFGQDIPAALPRTTAGLDLAEALSEREVEVLALMAEGLPSNEIAERLVIAVGTARTHIKNIYSKLQVHSRFEAVKRARDLGLIAAD